MKPGTELSPDESEKLLKDVLATMTTGHVVVSQIPAESPLPEGERVMAIEVEGEFVADSFHIEAGEAYRARTGYRVTDYRVAGTFDGDPVEWVLHEEETYLKESGRWTSGGAVPVLGQDLPSPVTTLDFRLSIVHVLTTTYVGTETIDGVRADRYELSDEFEGQDPAMANRTHLYLDPSGRPIRIEQDAPGYYTSTMDIEAHGEPVSIEAP